MWKTFNELFIWRTSEPIARALDAGSVLRYCSDVFRSLQVSWGHNLPIMVYFSEQIAQKRNISSLLGCLRVREVSIKKR